MPRLVEESLLLLRLLCSISSCLITIRKQFDYIIFWYSGWNADSFGFNLPILFVASLTMWFSGSSIQIGLHKPSHLSPPDMKSIWFQNPGGCCLIFAEMFNLNLLKSTKNMMANPHSHPLKYCQSRMWSSTIVLIDVKLPHPCNDFLGQHIPHSMFGAFTPTPQLDVSKD